MKTLFTAWIFLLLVVHGETIAGESRVEHDLAFLGPNREEKGDLYLPANRVSGNLAPAIVVIHGGSWNHGDKAEKQYVPISQDLASAGYVVFSINYKLSSKGDPVAWPQNLYDCKTAVRWLRKNAAKYAIDADHIGAIGGSSGGHLVALLALTSNEASLDPKGPYGEFSCAIQAAVDFYGVIDLAKHDYPMLGKTRAESPELYEKASPLSYIDKSGPPILIIHGTADDKVNARHSKVFAEALQKAGAPHELLLVEGASHSFDLQPKEKDLRPVVLGFFDKNLKAVDR
jgi:acetyl esterase/lipase